MEQLENILATAPFRRRINDTKFLRHVVNTSLTLPNPKSILKEEVIKEEVFGIARHQGHVTTRRQDRSTIVRVTANSVRNMLKHYYRGAGRFDDIRIALPPGSYVATFTRTEIDLGMLYEHFREVCPPNDRTRWFMDLIDHRALAIDACFEIERSDQYEGWSEEQIEVEIKSDQAPPPLPSELIEINRVYQPEPPNNGKYRLTALVRGSSERPLKITLVPTDYFSTHPVFKRMFAAILEDPDGQMRSPAERYGKDALNYDECVLPSIVCVHVTVFLSNGDLLLTQRVLQKTGGVDWEQGKWSPSFEENMASDSNVRERPDLNFFDTVEAGLKEELGTVCDRDVIRAISIVMDTEALAVDPIAIVRVSSDLRNVQAHWEIKARDGKAELRKVLAVEWSLEKMLPVLCGEDLVVGTAIIRSFDWQLSGRMRILVCLFHTFGIDKTLWALRDYSDRRAHSRSPESTHSAELS